MQQVGPINVLIVDDSPRVRTILTRVLSGESDINVVASAKDAYEGRECIISHRPDVIVLDIQMPRMSGLEFLRQLRVHYPVPVIMCSDAAAANGADAMAAMELGAVDVVVKPSQTSSQAVAAFGADLADVIRAAAVALPPRTPTFPSDGRLAASFTSAGIDARRYLIAIGASTGGTEAIKDVLCNMPTDFPPVVMVQHMPEGFTELFAKRLDGVSKLHVQEAQHRASLEVGTALLARGGRQMKVSNVGGRRRIAIGSEERVNRHCPSVDVLFDSIVDAGLAGRTIAVLLTGMGADGANGLLRLREAGAITIGQDQHSCVVYGMPKVAADIGAVQIVGRPAEIPTLILRAVRRSHAFAAAAQQ